MSSLVRKILIYAVSEGLVLKPLPQRDGQELPQPIILSYHDNNIELLLQSGIETQIPSKCFEAFGIVGLLTTSRSPYLISIIKREQVAQIYGKPIYVVTDVALTPLVSKSEAESSIGNTQAQLLKNVETSDNFGCSESEEDEQNENNEETLTSGGQEVVDNEDSGNLTSSHHKRSSSIAEDVMAKKGSYGRFAQNWFSKTGWAVDQRRNMGMTSTEDGSFISKLDNTVATKGCSEDENCSSNSEPLPNKSKIGITETTLQKLLRTTHLLIGSSKSFYFSYDWDITRSFLSSKTPRNDLPLSKQVLADYFWNFHLLKSFINAGQSSFSLPLMQGFIGQREFKLCINPHEELSNLDGSGNPLSQVSKWSMKHQRHTHKSQTTSNEPSPYLQESHDPEYPHKRFLLTLISRRSVRRAGLRYLRRGVDENGFTANFVETEQILSDPEWELFRRLSSFVQIRGSIPLFWSQSPYSFKPIPRLQQGEETNIRGFRAHIKNLMTSYGKVQAVSLVEKIGPEAIVGTEYDKLVKRLNEVKNCSSDNGITVGFEWWDFHANCRGLKFENVNLLLDILHDKLEDHGYTCVLEGKIVSHQNGVMRTNCMDCLDRTNVTQSACARKILEQQLKNEGVDSAFQSNQVAECFNNLWADNGDAISKQYASTAALKGDFTRTRKREFAGALKDVSLSISRFYNGIFNDYFSQAAIDFLLGNAAEHIFVDFDENFMTDDPAISMQRLRQQLIELCQKQVIADDNEEMIGGWTLLTPMVPNVVNYTPLQESVLLVTNAGLYICRVDWNLEKLLSFERIKLQSIQNIKYGTYITSTLSEAQMDEERNIGFVITYSAGNELNEIDACPEKFENSQPNGSLTSSISQVIPAFPRRAVAVFTAAASSTTTTIKTATVASKAKSETRVLAFKVLPFRSCVPDDGEDEMKTSEIDQIKIVCNEIERQVKNCRILKIGMEKETLVQHSDIISLDEARRSTKLFDKLSHNFKKLVWG